MKPHKLDRKSPAAGKLNLEALYAIAPSCFTEVHDAKTGETKRVVNFAMLRTMLGDDAVESDPEFYQFTWPGKQAARLEAAAETTETLRPVPADSLDWATTQNVYIEGDNLRVLKLLQRSYMGKVKMIYIDPPYNTGNDFIYHDDFARSAADEDLAAGNIDAEGLRFRKNLDSNGRFHSDWCSMMLSRLLVAHSLLSEDGVIFISIDDNEVHNLRKICDEVFGEKNFVNHLVWVSNITGRQIAGKGAAKTWETVLVYCKSITYCPSFSIDVATAKNKMPDAYKGFNKEIYEDDKGGFAIGDTLYNHNRKFNESTRPNLVYSIYYNPTTKEITTGDIGDQKDGFVEIPPHKNNDGTHLYHAWRWSREKVKNESYDLIILPLKSKEYEVYTRIRDFDKTLLKDLVTNISNGDSEVQRLFDGKKYFDYPKPTDLLSCLINVMPSSSLILDFFSGSATTAHAVMQLNAEDGGKRKYICVQLPEETPEDSEARKAGYATIPEIAKERIRRAGKKIKEEHPEAADTLDTGFRVFRLDTGNFEDVELAPRDYDQAQLDLFVDNIKGDRTELDLLFGALLSWGVPLSLSKPMKTAVVDGRTIYNVSGGELVACFAEKVTEGVVQAMAEMRPGRVLFRDRCFAEDKTKINLFELFKQALDWDEREALDHIRVI